MFPTLAVAARDQKRLTEIYRVAAEFGLPRPMCGVRLRPNFWQIGRQEWRLEAAEVIVFLNSSSEASINGTEYVIDGGIPKD